jgi:hypothetical protein
MTATKPKHRSGNPAKAAQPRYRPEIWHRSHQFALFGIIGATALTLLAGFLGPSAVTLTLGPRLLLAAPVSPAGVVKPNEWFVSIVIWAAIILGALGLWVGYGHWLMAGSPDTRDCSRSALSQGPRPSACRR